jgi:hypothetical protein
MDLLSHPHRATSNSVLKEPSPEYNELRRHVASVARAAQTCKQMPLEIELAESSTSWHPGGDLKNLQWNMPIQKVLSVAAV